MNQDDPAAGTPVRNLFLLALEQPESTRAAFVVQACGQDDGLRARVEALLRSHREDSFLESPASALNEGVPPAPADAPGAVIGRYKLIEKLGEGGCGTVYLAEQEEPVRRQVALKLIRAGMDTAGFVARFEAERQALALMDHPNIARVFDAGATETGRPYLVMELVRGTRITEYCDAHQLSTNARLELFAQVCRAVQHAHQKGIIHRDLKPSNVLVTRHDGVALPKVIDFGIAKATGGERLTDKTCFTAQDQFIGTPAYMSPEQTGMNHRDIDTRSDIYSLGVLLYELLTGTTPFDPHALWEAGYEAMARTICQQEPVRPSKRLEMRPAAELETTARHRGVEPSQLVHRVRGDLDWMVMKALEKERARRYATANDFAEDMQRHMRHEPVLAGPPSRLYRVRKLARRHRVAFATATLVLAVLVIGLGVASWGLWRERQARTRAESAERLAKAESKKSEQVSRILRNMLAGASPEIARGRDTTVLREMVDATAANIGRDARDQPEVEADVRTTLGGVYDALGLYAKAEAEHRQALALRKGILGAEHLDVAESLHWLATALFHQRKDAEAEPLFRQALAMRAKLLGPEHPEVARSMNNLALALRSLKKVTEAEALQSEAQALHKKRGGSNELDLATDWHNQADNLARQRKYVEAEAYSRRALAVFRRVHGDKHTSVASVQHGLASCLHQQGKTNEAEVVYHDTLRLKRELYNSGHVEIGVTLRNLGAMLGRSGRLAEAEALLREALDGARRGEVFSSRDLENCLYDVSSVALDRAWAEYESLPNNAGSRTNLAARAREAESLLRECLALHAQTAPTNDTPSARVRSQLAAALTLAAITEDSLAPGRDAAFAQAEALSLASHTRFQTSTSASAQELKRKAMLHLARLYQAWGKPEEAAKWQARLREQEERP